MSFWGEKKINILVGLFPPNDRKEIRDETLGKRPLIWQFAHGPV